MAIKLKFSHADVVYDHGAPLFSDVGGVNRHRIWFTPIGEDLMRVGYELHKADELSFVTWGVAKDNNIPMTDEQAIAALSTLKHADSSICEYVQVEVIV